MDQAYEDLVFLLRAIHAEPEAFLRRARERGKADDLAMEARKLAKLPRLTTEADWRPLYRCALDCGLFTLPQFIESDARRFDPAAPNVIPIVSNEVPINDGPPEARDVKEAEDKAIVNLRSVLDFLKGGAS